ncbi:uncharacterized protein LOC111064036 isoform X5 [Nilaparvata lugens]|uniref:uncharacterized protein LOC111064036 isoform X5 n=1 Tax=Nilaparvata lugens TaxID=108931 RepID=UPI00193D3921|nr:uncharacterized protein LOC111064036 isoform X5 [Nilaparvata lugens]
MKSVKCEPRDKDVDMSAIKKEIDNDYTMSWLGKQEDLVHKQVKCEPRDKDVDKSAIKKEIDTDYIMPWLGKQEDLVDKQVKCEPRDKDVDMSAIKKEIDTDYTMSWLGKPGDLVDEQVSSNPGSSLTVKKEEAHSNEEEGMREGNYKENERTVSKETTLPTAYVRLVRLEVLGSNARRQYQNQSSDHKFNVKTKRTLRNWNRRNFCIFCRTLVSNFRRHQLRHHPLEKEVIDFLSECDPDLKERKRKRQAIFDELRNRGNYLYNSNIESKSEILPIRRPDTTKKEVAYHKYVHCVHCLGAFSRKTFYRHESKCPKKILADAEVNTNSLPLFDSSKASNNVKDCRNHVLKAFSTTIFPSSVEDEELVKKIFSMMKKDEISLVAMNDTLIKSIGSQFLKNHMDKRDEYNASRKMRDASALLLYCRKDPAIKNLIDCFKPKHFCLVMEAAQKLSGFDESTGAVKVIGMPARLAYVIQEGAKLKSDTAILSDKLSRATKEAIKTETSEFLQLFKNKWKYYICRKNKEETNLTNPNKNAR